MRKNRISIIGLLAALILLTMHTGCKFNKQKKQTDPTLKLNAAKEYYENKKFSKALILLEDIVLITRGTDEGQEVMNMLSYSNYYVKDYILAGYYFRKYTEYYPKGKYAEEAMFMSAFCYYKDSPKTSLEQSATYTALQAFEIFISRYPKSPKIEECNKLVDELRDRLEKKSYDNAKLYYDMGYYNAASISLKNSLQSFPDTKYKESTLFYILKSSYEYAENSIGSKQKERYEAVLKDYTKFVSKFPTSEYAQEAERLKKNAEKKIEKLSEISSK